MKDDIHSDDFASAIRAVIDVLSEGNHLGQTDFLFGLIDFLQRGELEKFTKDINGPELWGGAGSVWEVEMQGSFRTKLDNALIDLLRQMRNKNILGKRAMSVYRMLRD